MTTPDNTTAAAWAELEDQLGERLGRTERGIYPDAPGELLLAITNPGAVPSFTLAVAHEAVGERKQLPEAKGLFTRLQPGGPGSQAVLEIALADAVARDVFTVLAQDIVDHVAAASDERAAVATWIARLERWQALLRRSTSGLTPERQRGLYSELLVIVEYLNAAVGTDAAIPAWTGPTSAVHDFQLPLGHVEVKSSVAGQPQEARINGERQLDDTGLPSLWLVHFSLATSRDVGVSLPEMVARARSLAADGPSHVILDERLMDAGYFDTHADRYATPRYTVRETRAFRIAEGFPRLIEAGLPDGIGGVSYVISIPACAPFAVEISALLDHLSGTSK